MVAHTLGNPFDLSAVKAFCDKYDLWLVEDNCDALGTQYTIRGETKYTGTIGDIGTSSFYPPHHMTMGEGGCVYTNDPKLNRLIKSFRDWGVIVCVRPAVTTSVDIGLTGSTVNSRRGMTINMCTATSVII